jgi:hypothetical protein
MNPKNSVVVRLVGGLGNQLFQYATGRYLADQKGVGLILDERYVARKHFISGLLIDKFSVRMDYFPESLAAKFSEAKLKLSRAMRRFIRPTFSAYHEIDVTYDSQLSDQKMGVMLVGFWQSEKYFLGHDILRKDLMLKAPLPVPAIDLVDRMEQTNSVAIHVRRGDYLSDQKTLAKHGVCSENYYREALKLIRNQVVDPQFFVFSDDAEWVKASFDLVDAVFVSDFGFAAEQDLVLISKCKHQIIANSSFSWWGAWLNGNAEKTVIAPTPWFDDAKFPDCDLVPPNWLKVPKS